MAAIATVDVGSLGLDYVRPTVPESRMAADGWEYVIRYIAQSTQIGKLVTPAEIARCHAAGIGMILNYESQADRAKLGGQIGASDGRWSRAEAQRLGYPAGLPILCSSFDAGIFYGSSAEARRQAAIAEEYGRAFAAELGPYRFGVYGGTGMIDRLKDISVLNWKALATSWSTFATDATIHVIQRRPTSAETARMPYATKELVDVNVTRTRLPMWLPNANAPDATPAPAPRPTPAPAPVPHVPPIHVEDSTMQVISRQLKPFDSRDGYGVVPANQRHDIKLGLPEGTTAAEITITTFRAEANGFLTAWGGVGSPDPPPERKSVGIIRGQDQTNTVTVPVVWGAVAIWLTVPAWVVIDVNAYWP